MSFSALAAMTADGPGMGTAAGASADTSDSTDSEQVLKTEAAPEEGPIRMDVVYGYDNVATKRATRTGEPRIRSFLSESFYKFVNAISKTEIVDGARDYRLMKRKMVQAVLEMSEYNRFSKGIFGWVGFRTKWLEYDNIERSAGTTKWSLWKLFKYSVEGITGFSVAPLSLASVVGVLFCVLSFIMIAVIIVRTLVWGDPVSGWPSLACIIFMVSGVQLLCTGIVGEYLSKTYLETKKRPIFILKDSSDEKEQKHERM